MRLCACLPLINILQVAKTRVVFVSLETLRKPKGVDVFIAAAQQNPIALQKEIAKVAGEISGRQSKFHVNLNSTMQRAPTNATVQKPFSYWIPFIL